MAMAFEVLARAKHNAARRGRLHTAHGIVETPVFMPVGTQGVVKALDPRDMKELGAAMVLANAYHLMLRPGSRLVAALGGLHRFCGFSGAILTDSGGYQVFSLADLREVTDRGVSFRSHIDGALIELSPEGLVRVQEDLAPDIAMVLDECPPAAAPRDVVARAVERTTRWASRALAAQARSDVAWFGIVQGGVYDDLRVAHAQAMAGLPFAGFAIGGVSVGEKPSEIERVVHLAAPLLPADKPRYLMGVGTPADLVRAVAAGVDMFDCVLPTRNARNGELFTSAGKLHIKNAAHRESNEPIDPARACSLCRPFSRAYLRHLFVASELGYHRLATWHNLAFYLGLMQRLRAEIEEDRFDPAAHLERMSPVA
ncbi:MAG: tRNA guanosine(34) transglycosylase Tgt [Deltaproteobacteria bacterium]|nr:tRNA guanosine(34) transglycosylase Tgt [Deltaproteobacteria bacterium]